MFPQPLLYFPNGRFESFELNPDFFRQLLVIDFKISAVRDVSFREFYRLLLRYYPNIARLL
jgi:hypothetical protein